jgi:hypothetical protein
MPELPGVPWRLARAGTRGVFDGFDQSGQEAGRIFMMDIQRHALLEPFVQLLHGREVVAVHCRELVKRVLVKGRTRIGEQR